MHSGLYYRQRPRGNLLSAMSLILFVLLQVVATQYVAFALPAPGTASTSVDTLPSQSSTCNDIHHCRTLISLVWSCLTTIFLCTWITVHLDVKEEGETSWTSRFLNRISSVCMMLFAPEMYALNSITEWADACNLVETLSSMCFSRGCNYLLTHPSTISKHPMDGDTWDDGSYEWI
jgi:hypothetical protein